MSLAFNTPLIHIQIEKSQSYRRRKQMTHEKNLFGLNTKSWLRCHVKRCYILIFSVVRNYCWYMTNCILRLLPLIKHINNVGFVVLTTNECSFLDRNTNNLVPSYVYLWSGNNLKLNWLDGVKIIDCSMESNQPTIISFSGYWINWASQANRQ